MPLSIRGRRAASNLGGDFVVLIQLILQILADIESQCWLAAYLVAFIGLAP